MATTKLAGKCLVLVYFFNLHQFIVIDDYILVRSKKYYGNVLMIVAINLKDFDYDINKRFV